MEGCSRLPFLFRRICQECLQRDAAVGAFLELWVLPYRCRLVCLLTGLCLSSTHALSGVEFDLSNEVVHHLFTSRFLVWFIESNKSIHRYFNPHKLMISNNIRNEFILSNLWNGLTMHHLIYNGLIFKPNTRLVTFLNFKN